MKTIIVGPQNFNNRAVLKDAIKKSGFRISEVITTDDPGVAQLSIEWAKWHSVPVTIFPLECKERAWNYRNSDMEYRCDAVILLWEPLNEELVNMARMATTRGTKLFVWLYEDCCCVPIEYMSLFTSR